VRNRTKSRIRCRAEHSIGVIKRVLGFTKVRYGGLAKNANRVFVTAALANVFLVRYTPLGTVRPQQGNKAGRPRFPCRNTPNTDHISMNEHSLLPATDESPGCADVP
jgi:hypothetical protein